MAEPFWLSGKRWAAFWAALTTFPLLWPALPPLGDLPGHMARLRVVLAGAESPLHGFYEYRFRWMGNLGLDLIVPPIARVIGLEPAVKLVMIATVFASAWGMLAVARAVHGRVPPTALFALPLALSWPLIFGFANFAISIAIALNAFALWIAMQRREALRAALFVPLGLIAWLAHGFGWGVLGLLAFAAELDRHRELGWPMRIVRAGLGCLPLTPPLIATLATQGGAGGGIIVWSDPIQKIQWLTMALRDRWQWFDLASVATLLGVLFYAVRSGRFSNLLVTAAALLLAAFLLLPWVLFGSAYADMRLAPYVLAVAILGIASMEQVRLIGLLALAFFTVRTAASTASFAIEGRRQEAALDALDQVPVGARLVSFVVAPCPAQWHEPRLDHLPAMAVVRRESFANDQWPSGGAPGVTILKTDAPGFAREPSQIVTDDRCAQAPWRTVSGSLRDLQRGAFDLVWVIDGRSGDRAFARPPDLIPIWSNGTDMLFRIERKPSTFQP